MKIKNLVIGGGGIKSFSYIGILQKLYNQNKLKYVKKLLGVSGGSILLYLYSIGYTPDELEKLAINLDLKALFGNIPGIAHDAKIILKISHFGCVFLLNTVNLSVLIHEQPINNILFVN